MYLKEIESLLGCTNTVDDKPIQSIVIDSRIVKQEGLFIAIKGENFDGHDFIDQAIENGAGALIVSKPVTAKVPYIQVDDTSKALGSIASLHRKHCFCPAIALTGSNGKTSVKEMIAAILPSPSLATKGNLNNHIGVPLSLLNLTKQHRYCVFELGANHCGEIAYTAAMVKPQVALITNIAPAHIGEFGSIDAIARTKGEIFKRLNPGGHAIINDDDSYAHFWDELIQDKKVIRFSCKNASDVYASNISFDANNCGKFTLNIKKQCIEISLKVPGTHNVSNALAAASACFALGITNEQIKKGLNEYAGTTGRLAFISGLNGATVIDDSYNANLQSVRVAIEVLANQLGKTIMVFGDMGELGDYTVAHHQKVGSLAKNANIDHFFSCGKFSALAASAFGKNGHHCQDYRQIISALKPLLDSHTSVLIKGSRAAKMENIVAQLAVCK
jgi:UDP-N-acetylmuramoyl-tripeptide--D-alanyl-D-alanine ligase